jgi:hypothetical protein
MKPRLGKGNFCWPRVVETCRLPLRIASTVSGNSRTSAAVSCAPRWYAYGSLTADNATTSAALRTNIAIYLSVHSSKYPPFDTTADSASDVDSGVVRNIEQPQCGRATVGVGQFDRIVAWRGVGLMLVFGGWHDTSTRG